MWQLLSILEYLFGDIWGQPAGWERGVGALRGKVPHKESQITDLGTAAPKPPTSGRNQDNLKLWVFSPRCTLASIGQGGGVGGGMEV